MENGGNKERVNSGNANFAWDISWELNTSRFDLATTSNSSANTLFTAASCTAAENSSSTQPEASSTNGFMFPQESNYWLYHHHCNNRKDNHQLRLPLYAGDRSHSHPDPHLMCLKLGKRHYFENHTNNISPVSHDPVPHLTAGAFSTIGKRGKPYYYTVGGGGCYEGLSSSSSSFSSSSVNVPRCQVEGCDVALANSKDYHKRHRVCEMHSKAPKVIVLGLEQRFCQQCSRFHVVSEFDDAKRSCRRRLAGHNERRRKSSHDSVSRISHQGGRIPYLTPPTGCALSLLSSKAGSCVSPSDLSSRSSAALRELIAEHRAAVLARQLMFERRLHHHHSMEDLGESLPNSNFFIPHQHQMLSQTHNWDRFHGPGMHLTLDLMQAPSSAFGFSSRRGKNKEEEEERCELWSTLAGAHVV